MYNHVPEIDEFELKAKMLTKRLEYLSVSSCTEYIDINSLSEFLCIDKNDMKSIVYYLKRGEIIQTDKEKNKVKLTEYGKMIYCDNQVLAHAPIIC